MKKYIISPITIFIIALLLTSCSNKIFFTNEMRLKLDDYDLEINKVQFYTSKKIVFRRVLPYDSAKIARGEIRFENGKLIESIIIKKNTPGTCEFVNDGILNMTFEQGDDKYLKFKPNKSGNYYELFVKQDLLNYGEIVYDSIKYIIQPGSERARLLVKKNEDYLLRVQQRIIKGRKVNN